MVFAEVGELLLAILVLAFFVSQIFIPLFRGTTLLPMFSKESKLDKEIRVANQSIVEEELEERLKNIKEEPERRKNPKAFFIKKHFDKEESKKQN